EDQKKRQNLSRTDDQLDHGHLPCSSRMNGTLPLPRYAGSLPSHFSSAFIWRTSGELLRDSCNNLFALAWPSAIASCRCPSFSACWRTNSARCTFCSSTCFSSMARPKSWENVMLVMDTACTVIQYGDNLTLSPSSISFFSLGRSWMTFSTGKR